MTYGRYNFRQIKRTAVALLMITAIAVLLFTAFCPSAGAVGLVDDSVDAAHEYSRYPLENYQLDFYVDNGWDWLPWNWIDGIGKQVMYGLYCITNFIWTINLYLSNASGYLVQEAYGLDFISDAADEIGRNIQSIAGISPSGLSSDGFYAGFLLLIILIVGAYVAYVGLIKRETTKAVRAVMNMVMIFVLSGALIAYAPDCVKRLNEFSEDVSTASLSVGTKIVLPDAENSGADSVDLIRDSLFSIQVKQPWLLLQFGDTDTDAVGEERIDNILSASPSENNGEDRENAVKAEIEDNGNTNLTVTKTVNRLGTVFFLFLFNIGISVFVFLLTGMMIFSQVLFIIYAMFLPVSFVLSMAPTFEGSSRRAVIKLFNTILARAGITLVITVAFSISTMLYRIASGYPFFIIAFLQVGSISSWATCSAYSPSMTTVPAAWAGISCTARGCSCTISFTGSTVPCARRRPADRMMAAVRRTAVPAAHQGEHTGTAVTGRTVEAAGHHSRVLYTVYRKHLQRRLRLVGYPIQRAMRIKPFRLMQRTADRMPLRFICLAQRGKYPDSPKRICRGRQQIRIVQRRTVRTGRQKAMRARWQSRFLTTMIFRIGKI